MRFKKLLLFICIILINRTALPDHIKYQLPTISEIVLTQQKSRLISEIDFLSHIKQKGKKHYLLSTKFKKDNQQSMEVNLGLVYRNILHNRYIFSFYNYYDRRSTRYNLSVYQWTTGLELLSENYDLRANAYLAQKKKKIIGPPSIELKNESTSFFALSTNIAQEHSLNGYDVEIGIPFLHEISLFKNSQLLISKYYFHRHNVATKEGVRFKLEKQLRNNINNDYFSAITIFAGGKYMTDRYWSDFQRFKKHHWQGCIGLKVKTSLRKKNHKRQRLSKLQQRIMNPIARDVDIVTSIPESGYSERLPLYKDNQIINNIYFVGHTDDPNYQGDGTAQNPFSIDQLKRLKNNNILRLGATDIVMPATIDKTINEDDYQNLIAQMHQHNNHEKELSLTTKDYIFNIKMPLPNIRTRNISLDSDTNNNKPCLCTCKDNNHTEQNNEKDLSQIRKSSQPRALNSIMNSKITPLPEYNNSCDYKPRDERNTNDSVAHFKNARFLKALATEEYIEPMAKPNLQCSHAPPSTKKTDKEIKYYEHTRLLESLITKTYSNFEDRRKTCQNKCACGCKQ
ncbi:MAG: hypothetical protein DGJ47_000631 [Rickettsiaceae bacterium]